MARKPFKPSHQHILDGKIEALRKRAIAEEKSQQEGAQQMRKDQGNSQQASAAAAAGSSLTTPASTRSQQLQHLSSTPDVHAVATQQLLLMQQQHQAATPTTADNTISALFAFLSNPSESDLTAIIIAPKKDLTKLPASTDIFTQVAPSGITRAQLFSQDIFVIVSEYRVKQKEIQLDIKDLKAVVVNQQSQGHCALAAHYLATIKTQTSDYNIATVCYTKINQQVRIKFEYSKTAAELQKVIEQFDTYALCLDAAPPLVAQRLQEKMQQQAHTAQAESERSTVTTQDASTQTENFLLKTPAVTTTMPAAPVPQPLNLATNIIAATPAIANDDHPTPQPLTIEALSQAEIKKAEGYGFADIQKMNIEQSVRTGLALLLKKPALALYCTLKAAFIESDNSKIENYYQLQARRNLYIFLNKHHRKQEDAVFLCVLQDKPDADSILNERFMESRNNIAWFILNYHSDGLQEDTTLRAMLKQAADKFMTGGRPSRRASITPSTPTIPDQAQQKPESERKKRKREKEKNLNTSAEPKKKKICLSPVDDKKDAIMADATANEAKKAFHTKSEPDTESEDESIKQFRSKNKRSRKRRVIDSDDSDEDAADSLPLSSVFELHHLPDSHDKLGNPTDDEQTTHSRATTSTNGAGLFVVPKPAAKPNLSVTRNNITVASALPVEVEGSSLLRRMYRAAYNAATCTTDAVQAHEAVLSTIESVQSNTSRDAAQIDLIRTIRAWSTQLAKSQDDLILLLEDCVGISFNRTPLALYIYVKLKETLTELRINGLSNNLSIEDLALKKRKKENYYYLPAIVETWLLERGQNPTLPLTHFIENTNIPAEDLNEYMQFFAAFDNAGKTGDPQSTLEKYIALKTVCNIIPEALSEYAYFKTYLALFKEVLDKEDAYLYEYQKQAEPRSIHLT